MAAEKIQALGLNPETAASVIVGDLSDYATHVRLIALYEEKAPGLPKDEAFCDCRVIGPHGSETKQILALAVKTRSAYSEMTLEELKSARLVHLSRRVECGTGATDYSKADPVSFDAGFIDALFKLAVSLETALQLFVERFGLVAKDIP